MNPNEVPTDLAARVNPADLELQAKAAGWYRLAKSRPGVAVLRRHDDPTAELLIPLDRTFGDFAARIAEAISELAQSLGVAAREVLSQLLMPIGDMLRFRVSNPTTAAGFLPLPSALDLLSSCRQSLLAAACTVISPQKFYPRMGSQQTEDFLSNCKLGTERGSFVATVLCPLDIGGGDAGQMQMPLAIVGASDPFSRKVVGTVLRSTADIVTAIDSERIDTLLDGVGAGALVSANFCEALAQTEDIVTEACPLSIEAHFSPIIPVSASMPTKIMLHSKHFPALRAVAAALRPAPQSKASRFIGHIISLTRDNSGSGELFGGDVILSFQDDEERPTRARLSLSLDDYNLAIAAHRSRHYVSVEGLLERAPRVSRISNPTNFRDLADPKS